jgi:SNF2 family DNA or RNA helicase
MARKPWKHQVEAFEFAKDKNGVMLAMDMGTGKSFTTVALCKEHKARKVLILCPLSVVGVWPREFEQNLKGFVVTPLDSGSVAEKAKKATFALTSAFIGDQSSVIVCNYESAWREPFKTFATKAKFDVVVLDESHRIKSPGGKASRNAAQFIKQGCKIIALTGTPAPHSPADLYAQFRAIDPEIFGTSFNRFKKRYALMGGFQNHQIIGWRNQVEMKEKFDSVAITIKKEDALDLPEINHVDIPVILSKKARGIYELINSEFWALVDEGHITASNALVKLLKLQQITGGFIKDDDEKINLIDEAKNLGLKDLLSDCNKPAVVFCRFRQDIQNIRKVCEELKLKHGEVSGEVKDLDEARFPKDKEVLIVQIQAGGVGIDLSRASIGIYYSMGFNLGDYLQSQARLHRPGQRHNVTFYHLVATKTVDEKVYKALQARADVIESILGGEHERSARSNNRVYRTG